MDPNSTPTQPKTTPLGCTRCGGEGGPLDLATGLCEDCEPEVASALRGAAEAGE